MIDFKDNILYFGDGDILVNNSLGGLMFVNCKPPLEVGTELTEELREELGVKYTSDWITVPILTYEEAKQLIELLDSMDGGDKFKFEFKGWTFNFANWNPKSVEVIKKYVNYIKTNLLLSLAC